MKKSKSFMPLLLGILVMGVILFAGSCSKDDDKDPGATASATVSGRVVTPSGKSVPSAKIKSGTFTTTSDVNGDFVLTCDAANTELVLYTGEGRIFKTIVSISLVPGQNLALPETETMLKQIADLAYIAGTYDEIQTLIIDSLGYSATEIFVSDLSSLSQFSNYAGLFLNCGLLNSADMDSLKYVNLMEYAVAYGSIYASDFAVECFTGDGNMRLAAGGSSHNHDAESGKSATQCINPLIGGFIPDSALCTQKIGSSGSFYDAVILDQDLVTAVGNDSLNLIYDLGGWEVIQNYDVPFTPIIEHSMLGVLAVKTDLNDESSTGGIYFTTFHNNPQGVSNEIESILSYIILNL